MDPVAGIVDGWLRADLEQPVKQRHTAHRVWRRLVDEHGFNGAEPTVRRWVRERKMRLKSWGARRGGGPSGWKGAAAGAGVHPPAGAGAASRDNWGSGCLREGAKSYVKRLRPDRGSVSYVVIIGALVLFLWSERLRLILTKRIGLRYA